MLKRGWFGGGLWRPKNPHSLEHLRYLYAVLSKNQVVQDSNRSLLVETLRSIAEILIWGDQNDSSVFDFFLEKNMLSFFLRIMKQKCGSYVCVQLLQTLNILFENIRNETSLYYLLSNNHVNSIIVHKFDFSDEEVMAYYISFLKTLSLKLNSHTIHFFYNEHTNDFPLYTEAIKFFNHPESMVRIAVRTLTLNVYRVEDRSMLQFIRDRTAAPYFSNLVWFIGNHILELDNCVRMDIDHSSRDRLADLVAEHLDHLHYLNDILKLNITELNHVLADHLLNRLLVPLLVYSLNRHHVQDDRPRVSRVVALFLLAQVFLIFSYSPLMQVLARIILHGDNSIFADSSPTVEGSIRLRPGFIAPEESLEQSLLSHSRAGSAYGSQDEFDVESTKSGYSDACILASGEEENLSADCSGDDNLSSIYEGSEPSFKNDDNSKFLSNHDGQLSGCTEDKLLGYIDCQSVQLNLGQNIGSNKSSNLPKRKSKQFSGGESSSQTIQGSSDALSLEQKQSEESSSKTSHCDILMTLSTMAGISELEATHVNITDEEKEQLKYSDIASSGPSQLPLKEVTLAARPFLQSILEALNCTENDYSALFSLCLLYAIGHNTGINKELISSSLGKKDSECPRIYYNSQLVDCLLRIISHSAQYNSKIRVATLEMALNVLQHLIGLSDSFGPSVSASLTSVSTQSAAQGSNVNCNVGYLRDQHLAALEGAKEEATLLLRNFYKGEEIFLDMFEDEWRELNRRPLNVEYLLQDASILLPPAGTPLTGIDFNKRLPCGEVERARRSMRVFFLIRALCLKIRGESDSHLPLTNPAACVQVSDVLDLNNSDLIACVVITRDGQRTRRFLVIDIIQLILVEPDQRRLGWGVAKFVGFLQDLEVVGDKDDSRVLHITIHRPSVASFSVGRPATPLLAAKFIFDDHIRCMAAKQRLSKGRLKARQRKLHQIARLLEMPSHLQPCPSPPAHALSTMRQEAQRRGNRGGMEGRSRSLVHKGKFNQSSRGPGVALKKEGNSAGSEDNSQMANSDLSTSCSSTEPLNSRMSSFSKNSSRSSSRPRPRSEEIPLENLSPPPATNDCGKIVFTENQPSLEVPTLDKFTNKTVIVSSTGAAMTMETIVITGSAIPIYRVAEQVPFISHCSSSNVQASMVPSPLCSVMPSGELSVVPLRPVLTSKHRKKSRSKSLKVVPFTHIEIPDGNVDIKEGPSSDTKTCVSKPNISIANCSSRTVEKGVSHFEKDVVAESCGATKSKEIELPLNECSEDIEKETSFSSKPNCPKSSSFDFFEAQDPKLLNCISNTANTIQPCDGNAQSVATESISKQAQNTNCCLSRVDEGHSFSYRTNSSSSKLDSEADSVDGKIKDDSVSGFSPIRKLKDSNIGKVEII